MVTVSVIMGIYNCANTLHEAINSILNQSFTDWELIMCDDGSQDNTYKVATEYQMKYPDKIVLLRNAKNLGLNATLNKCLSVASGKYIARMDGDDICSPDRFNEEISVLENESCISIVSTDMVYFDDSGVWGRISLPEYPKKEAFLQGTPFCHASSMIRKEALVAVQGYSVDDRLLRVEDYHLWLKMYKAGYVGKNVNKSLYSMRDDRNAYKRRKLKYRINEAYVRYLAVKELRLPFWGYVYALKPIAVGLMPEWIYDKLHRHNLNNN